MKAEIIKQIEENPGLPVIIRNIALNAAGD